MTTETDHGVKGLDTGAMVRAVQRGKRVTHASLARTMGRRQSTVSRLLRGTSVQTYVLWELSAALGHNFFADLSAQFNTADQGKAQASSNVPATDLTALQRENEALRIERDTLLKVIDRISAGKS